MTQRAGRGGADGPTAAGSRPTWPRPGAAGRCPPPHRPAKSLGPSQAARVCRSVDGWCAGHLWLDREGGGGLGLFRRSFGCLLPVVWGAAVACAMPALGGGDLIGWLALAQVSGDISSKVFAALSATVFAVTLAQGLHVEESVREWRPLYLCFGSNLRQGVVFSRVSQSLVLRGADIGKMHEKKLSCAL